MRHLHVERFQAARRDPVLAVLEGFHALKHALRFGASILAAVSRDTRMVEGLARELAPDLVAVLAALVQPVSSEEFRQLAPRPPATGVIALAQRPVHRAADILDREGTAPIVLLDRPAHHGNVGAVVRVAAASGAAAVLTSGPLDPWHPAAIRGSAGLHFALPVARLRMPLAAGRAILAFDAEGEPLRAALIPAGAILAFGTERGGLAPELQAQARRRLAIPMRAGVSSLNLATAVAVALYTMRAPEHRHGSTLP